MTPITTEQPTSSASAPPVPSYCEIPDVSQRAMEIAEMLNDVFEAIEVAESATTRD